MLKCAIFCRFLFWSISKILKTVAATLTQLHVRESVPIFADFLDFENGCCYLNTISRKRRKNTRVSCIFT